MVYSVVIEVLAGCTDSERDIEVAVISCVDVAVIVCRTRDGGWLSVVVSRIVVYSVVIEVLPGCTESDKE